MGSALLSVEGVSKSYRRGRHELPVLSEVSFELAAGEIAALLGGASQGKTTMLRIAAGLERPDEGRVVFDRLDLASLSDGRLSRLMGEDIGWIGRSGPAIALQMLDYVAMPLLIARKGHEAHRRAQAALRRVGIAASAEQIWASLSDSERARAAIAHAIVRGPRLLIVEDLTKGLGIGETDEVAGLLQAVARESGAAVLMAVSDAAAALRSDRVMTLSGGRLIQAPTPADNVIEFPGGPVAPAL